MSEINIFGAIGFAVCSVFMFQFIICSAKHGFFEALKRLKHFAK